VKQTIRILFSILRSPLLVGSAASVVFYTAVNTIWWLDHPFVQEYFAGHPIEYVTTTLFFVGLAALMNKMFAVVRASSWARLHQVTKDRVLSSEAVSGGGATDPSAQGYQPRTLLRLEECGPVVDELDRMAEETPADKVTCRVRDVLDRMVRSGTADHLDEELRCASDLEADRVYNEYALFRVVIWAIPILGFLGTVVGITMAIAKLSPEQLTNSIPLVTASLSVAFATTIQALSLSIVLMFAKYLVSQAEERLARLVDHVVERELLGRFQSVGASPDGQVYAIRQMAETMVRASEQLVRQQAQLWHESIEASEQRWAQVTATAGKQLETALVTSLSRSLKEHAEELARNEVLLAAENREHWSQVNEGLQGAAQATTSLEESVERQVLVLQKTVEATGQVARLEEALNRNLASLTRSNQLEQISTSLTAAIHLLSARLAEVPSSNIQLDSPEESSSAA
jgi:hypothetical protein